jgi:hydroxymethylbilane synthase
VTRVLRLGTRGSHLAMLQSELVAERLRARGHRVELVRMVSHGDDRAPGTPLGDGIFVSAFEEALLEDEIDLAVHSAKDMALGDRGALVVAAYPERADPRDALVTSGGGATIASLPDGAVVGTDSPRRGAFLRCRRPDVKVVPMQGNVDTRLRKLDQGAVDALVLAAAGLERLGRGDRIDCRLDAAVMPPAPAQGALAVQARAADTELVAALGELDEPAVRLAVETERLVLEEVGGGCRSPIGALAEVAGDRLRLLAGAVAGSRSRLLLLEDDADRPGSARAARAAGRQLREHLESGAPREETTRRTR